MTTLEGAAEARDVADAPKVLRPAGHGSCSVLAVYLEPAPYIVGLVENLRAVWDGRVDVAYAALGLSQPWADRIGDGDLLLPPQVPAALGRIRRLLAGRHYGILHLAGWGHPVLLGALLLAKWYGVPVAIESDTPPPVRTSGWKVALKRILYPRLFSLPKVFLPGGSRQARYLRDYGVGDERIRIARMTVDVVRIQAYLAGREAEIRQRFRKRSGIPADAIVVLFLGRLEPHKGVLDLLQAFKAVGGPGLVLAIGGDGSLRSAVESAAAGDGRVRYLGRLAGDAVWEAYGGSDLLVVPSHFEPWGLVVNEAMATGLPVIVSERAGCVDDLLREAATVAPGPTGTKTGNAEDIRSKRILAGMTGFIIPAESIPCLSEAIVRLVRNPGLRRRLGGAGRMLMSGWTLRGQAERTVAAWRIICR